MIWVFSGDIIKGSLWVSLKGISLYDHLLCMEGFKPVTLEVHSTHMY